jgi:hypothetical protein
MEEKIKEIIEQVNEYLKNMANRKEVTLTIGNPNMVKGYMDICKLNTDTFTINFGDLDHGVFSVELQDKINEFIHSYIKIQKTECEIFIRLLTRRPIDSISEWKFICSPQDGNEDVPVSDITQSLIINRGKALVEGMYELHQTLADMNINETVKFTVKSSVGETILYIQKTCPDGFTVDDWEEVLDDWDIKKRILNTIMETFVFDESDEFNMSI